jgi:hypothetical protein
MVWNTAPGSVFFRHNSHRDKLGLLGQCLTRVDDSSIEVDHRHVRSKQAQVADIDSELSALVEGIKYLLMHRGNRLPTA